jgi:hypothetical protein
VQHVLPQTCSTAQQLPLTHAPPSQSVPHDPPPPPAPPLSLNEIIVTSPDEPSTIAPLPPPPLLPPSVPLPPCENVLPPLDPQAASTRPMATARVATTRGVLTRMSEGDEQRSSRQSRRDQDPHFSLREEVTTYVCAIRRAGHYLPKALFFGSISANAARRDHRKVRRDRLGSSWTAAT